MVEREPDMFLPVTILTVPNPWRSTLKTSWKPPPPAESHTDRGGDTMTVQTAVSFEVYPPRSPDKLPGLHESIRALDSVSPEFISVTFGAGGSSTRDSLGRVELHQGQHPAKPLAHLTCVGTTRPKQRAHHELCGERHHRVPRFARRSPRGRNRTPRRASPRC
jgi:hypothetical protein